VPRGKTFGTDPDFDPALVRPRESRPPAHTFWTRPGADVDTVKRAMTDCGYTDLSEPLDAMRMNDVAAAQLCMLDNGYRYAHSYQSLLCVSVPGLSACRGKAGTIDRRQCCAAPKAAAQ
jgi:hypothetical protein